MSTLLNNLNIIHFNYSDPATREINQSDPITVKWRYIFCAGMCLVSIPLVYQKSLGTLRYFSIAIFLIIMYTIFVTVLQTPSYHNAFKDNEMYHVDWFAAPF